MIFLQLKYNLRKREGTKHIKHKHGSFIASGVLVLIGLLGMASICLAQGSTWATKADMLTPRYQHGTCVVNGKIYAIGGETTGNGCNWPGSQSVEEYNPLTDTWTIKEDMPTARQGLSISAINGKIYAIGGHPLTCSGQLSTVEEYDPITDTWYTNKTPMPTARGGLSTSVVNGKIYAIGGYNYSANTALKDVEEYDPITNTWTPKADMLTARAWLSTCVANEKIYAFGGHGTVPPYLSLRTVEEYDPVTDNWIPMADMPIRLQNSPASTVNGLIYLFGGSTTPGGPPVSYVMEYNPVSDIWLSVSQMSPARTAALSSELNGQIYVIGGSTTDWPFQPQSTVQVYTPPVTSVEDPSWGENNPNKFALHQNYPNPFNPTTAIEFSLPHTDFVTLKIYNILGKEVAMLVSEKLNAGNYSYSWDGGWLASGVYLYKIEVGQGFVRTRKMVLLR